MFLIGGSASKNLTEDLSKITSIPIADTDIYRFPDGELYIRIKENLKDQDTVLVQTTYPDDKIIELFLLLDACKRANAKKITTIIPYFGYARQDKQFKPGEPVSAEALARLISINSDRVITIDPHKEYIKNFFSIPTKNISAIPAISSYLNEKQVDVVLAPDKGALSRAKDAGKQLKCEVDYLEKTRIDGSTISIKTKKLDVNNQIVVIIDDIISTGGTMAAAIRELKKQKAKLIYVACTHGLFAGKAIEKLKNAQCDEIIATDTIQTAHSKVRIAPLLAPLL